MVRKCSTCKLAGHISTNRKFHALVIKPKVEDDKPKDEDSSGIDNLFSNLSLNPSKNVDPPKVMEQPPVTEPIVSANKVNIDAWLKKGNTIPNCINNGCTNPVAIRHWSIQGDPSLKTECSRCSTARKNDKVLENITFHKKKYCENKDGVLKFVCPMDPTRYSEFPSDIYHMDHLDGDHHNNVPENLKTFCAICHTRKGKESGDFNGFKDSSRIHKA